MIDYRLGAQLGSISGVSDAYMFGWRNDPKIYKWCRQYEPISLDHHDAWSKSLSRRKDVKMYGIWHKDMGRTPLGVCGLTSIDLINRHAEFSLYIGPEHHGQGYGEAALKTLCAHGFLALGLNHIFGETFEKNPAAKMFKNVGFTKDGVRRKYYYREGKFIDAHMYGLLAAEFRKKWNL